jgi:Calcineurin-like phosphoesterase
MAGTSKKPAHLRSLFDEPVFGEGVVTPDPGHFSTRHPSDEAEYRLIEQLLYKDVVGFDKSHIAANEVYELATAFGSHGPQVVQQIQKNGRIVFHALGDSGCSDVRKYGNEIRVFDQIADDVHTAVVTDRPSFLYHLGDVIYNFGEAKYYYDQFYEPNRNYPGPIFAIPGNHDSFILPDTADADFPLVTFARNFCAESPVITREAGSLHRTAMTQPGVYFNP